MISPCMHHLYANNASLLRMGFVLLAFALGAPFSASASSFGERLYQVEVPVSDRSEGAREEATREGGKRVLTRITGYRDPADREELEELIDGLERWVDSYQYVTREDNDEEELKLRVEFDDEALDRAVQAAEAPLWGRERPRTLVWLALRDGNEREILTEEDALERVPELLDAAKDRGIPLIFPIMDLEDRGAVGFADIWGGFDEEVLEASARYGANAILIGRIDQGSDRTRARWTLYEPDGDNRWQSEAEDRAEALAAGVDETADRFANRFAVIGGGDAEEDRIELRVRDLGRLEDYVEAERYLSDLTPVENVRLESLERDTAVFSLAVRGGRNSLDRAIRLGDRLVPVETSEEDDAAGLVPVETLSTYRFRS